MKEGEDAYSKQELIKIITKNIPLEWTMHFKMAELHKKTRIIDILTKLLIIEEQTTIKSRDTHNHEDKMLKNPCRIHGSHEWEDCQANPKNQKHKEEEPKQKEPFRKPTSGANGRNHERKETRNMELTDDVQNEQCSKQHFTHHQTRNCSDSSDYEEYNFLTAANSNKIKSKDGATGAEILITIPNDLGLKKYTPYVGLVDSGASSSLLNQALIEQTRFEKTSQVNTTTRETHTGQFETTGKVTLANYCLPQFTTKYKLTSTFHMFQKMPNDKYDFVLGCDILQELALDLCYSAKSFVWQGMSTDMVPRGFWTAGTIANFWYAKRQSKATENSFKQNINTDADTYLTPSKEMAEKSISVTERHTFSISSHGQLVVYNR
jgi:hypothetical protein